MSNLTQFNILDLINSADFIEVTSYAEMEARPNFQKDIDPKLAKPIRILAAYVFKKEVPCGVPDCHEPHGKGYLVLYSNGAEGNMGHVCGEKTFGEEFKVLQRQFQRLSRLLAYRRTIESFQLRADSIQERIAELRNRPHGADWVHWSGEHFLERLPDQLRKQLRDRARRGETAVYDIREMTDEEVELERTMLGRGDDSEDDDDQGNGSKPNAHRERRITRNLVGHLLGLEVFTEPSIREVLIEKLQTEVTALNSLRVGLLKENQLRNWSKWCDEVEQAFTRAEALVSAGRSFFQKENVKLFLKLVEQLPKEEARAMRGFAWDYDGAKARG
jgi:hypothetical protein